MKKHLIKCNPKRPVSLTCEKCLKNFSTKSNLNKHMKVHEENVEVLWMIDGQKIDFTKHEDSENDIEQQMVISSKEIVKSVLDIIVNDKII